MTNEKYTDFNPDANVESNADGDIVAPGPDVAGPVPDFETDEDRARYGTRHDKPEQARAAKHEAQYADAQVENLMEEHERTAAEDLGSASLAAEGITAPEAKVNPAADDSDEVEPTEFSMPRVFAPSPNWEDGLVDRPVMPGAKDTPERAKERQEEREKDAQIYAKTGAPMSENRSEAEQTQSLLSGRERYEAELNEIEIALHDQSMDRELRLQHVTRKQKLEHLIAAKGMQLKNLGHKE